MQGTPLVMLNVMQVVPMTAKRVLVIDDEDHVREVVQTCLETFAEWQVSTATSAQEGLQKARTEQPDGILLDIMMPNLEGLQLLQHLQADRKTRSIPVVLLTAKTDLIPQAYFTHLGIVAAIAKPFSPLGLAHQVANVLGWSSQE